MKQFIKPFILWYLRVCANIQMWKIRPMVIGVGGSSGKSSLVKLLASTLSEKYKVRHSGGKNSEIGLPLNILGLTITDNSFTDWVRLLFLAKWKLFCDWQKYDIYIAEMGIDGPKEPYNMAYLLKIVKPHIGVVTNVSLEHSVYFDPLVKKKGEQRTQELLELIAKEETRLLTALPEEGTAIINLDDAFIGNTQKINSHKVSISLKNKTADLYIERIHIALERFVMEFLWKGKNYSLTIPQALPEFYAYEFLFVLATCMGLGMGPSEVLNSLENHFSLPPGRLSIFQGITNTTIIDSSYNNATLEPILGILDMLKKIAQDRRKVAIVGDMREQGSQSKESHEVLADKIAHCVSIPILIGPLLANYAAPILKRKKKKFYSFQTFSEAKKTILSVIEPRDIILVKGSQNTLFLERAVEILLADKDNVKSLCRRGIFWDRLREKTP